MNTRFYSVSKRVINDQNSLPDYVVNTLYVISLFRTNFGSSEPEVYVTGYWKTDHVHTFGQLLFIGPTDSHTHTLSMHYCNTRLSCLVCFSRADFADHVKSRLRQWDPWRALDRRYGSDIHPCVSEMSHRPSRLVKAYD